MVLFTVLLTCLLPPDVTYTLDVSANTLQGELTTKHNKGAL